MSASASSSALQSAQVGGFEFDAEWSFLAAACTVSIGKNRPLGEVGHNIRWKRVLELADWHGVQPLLYQALSTSGAPMPPGEMVVLNQLHQTNLHKALFLARELIRIVACCAEADIEVLPYKGLALAESAYGDIALRQVGDIDLLIRGRDFLRVQEIVRGLGYTPQTSLTPSQLKAYLKSGYECSFDGTAGRNLLEVQWAIQPRFYAVDFDAEGIFRRAVAVRVVGQAMKTPSTEDLFLILSLHAAKHAWSRLIWLCDLARIIQRPNLNWEWIASQAEVMGVVRILRVTIVLMRQLLNAEIPAIAEESLPRDPKAAELVREIGARIVGGNAYDVESLEYFRLMLGLRERRWDRVRFVTRLVFTPGPGEWSAVRLPPIMFPLYRIVRFWRLTRRLLAI